MRPNSSDFFFRKLTGGVATVFTVSGATCGCSRKARSQKSVQIYCEGASLDQPTNEQIISFSCAFLAHSAIAWIEYYIYVEFCYLNTLFVFGELIVGSKEVFELIAF